MPLAPGLPVWPDDSLDSKTFNALVTIHNAIKNLDSNASLALGLDKYPAGEWSNIGLTGAFSAGNQCRMYAPVGAANVVPGNVIYLSDNGTNLVISLARADNVATTAVGIVTVGGNTGDIAEFQFGLGATTAISGITPGSKYWLSSTVAGAITATRPSGGGTFAQAIGVGGYGNLLLFNISLTADKN